MTKKEQAAYDQGNRAAYETILQECSTHLGIIGDPTSKAAGLVRERDEARKALRNLCVIHNLPNDWPDDLHLADIINKHITPNL